MQTTKYSNIDCVIKDAINDEKRGFTVCCVVDNNTVIDYVLKFINLGYKLMLIDYDSFDYSGEYYVTIMNNELWIEKIWHLKENKEVCYLSECNMLYFSDKCDKEILNHIDATGKVIFSIE